MRVDIVIDELLLVGFGPCARHVVADAVEREVAARVHAGALREELTSSIAPDMRAADCAVPDAHAAGFSERLGAGVAGSLVSALSGREQ